MPTNAIIFDWRDVKVVARELRSTDAPAAASARTHIKEAAELIAEAARSNAATFSKRIPGSIQARVTTTWKARIVASGKKASDAAALENKGQGNPRHPLFGNREHWYVTNHGPYLQPAVDQHIEEVTDVVARVLDDVIHEIGFR